jgi:hypothetical protein
MLVLPMRHLYTSWTSGTPRACEGGQKYSCVYKCLIGTFFVNEKTWSITTCQEIMNIPFAFFALFTVGPIYL